MKPVKIRFRRMKGKLGLAHLERWEITLHPSNHCQGFMVLTFDKTGMLLEPEPCRVINGKAYFRGEVVS